MRGYPFLQVTTVVDMDLTQDVDDQVDSGLGSLDFLSENRSSISHRDTAFTLDKQTSKPADLDTALSALNIVENKHDVSKYSKDKDSGVYTSLSSQNSFHSSNVSLLKSETHKSGEQHTVKSLDLNKLSEVQIKGFVHINSDWDSYLNIHIINERTQESLALINLAPDPDWLNMKNTLFQTPLHLAVVTRQPAVVRRLICAGANVLIQDHMGNTPLHCACILGYDEVVHHFLIPVHYDETRQNSYKIPFQRLPQVSSIRNFEGDTCLHVAAQRGHLRIVGMLLDTDADPNIGDGKAGRTVLHHAAETGNKDLVRLLISKRRVDLNALDYAKRTPARLASGRLQQNILQLLQKHGAAPPVSSDTSDNDWHEEAMDCRHDASG